MGFFDEVLAAVAETGQPSGEVWFRGQADASWPLVPGLLRLQLPAEQEKNMLARFRLRAMGLLEQYPPDDDPARWLFLMQHHGLPTRILDWSESALCAAFFAIAAEPHVDGRLFILVPMALNEWQIDQRLLIAPKMSPCDDMFWASFKGSKQPEKIVAVAPYASNERLARQRGAFTVHGIPVDLARHAPNNVLRSIQIPAATKHSLREQLAHLGITRTTLFPDLDALACELREEYGMG